MIASVFSGFVGSFQWTQKFSQKSAIAPGSDSGWESEREVSARWMERVLTGKPGGGDCETGMLKYFDHRNRSAFTQWSLSVVRLGAGVFVKSRWKLCIVVDSW